MPAQFSNDSDDSGTLRYMQTIVVHGLNMQPRPPSQVYSLPVRLEQHLSSLHMYAFCDSPKATLAVFYLSSLTGLQPILGTLILILSKIGGNISAIDT